MGNILVSDECSYHLNGYTECIADQTRVGFVPKGPNQNTPLIHYFIAMVYDPLREEPNELCFTPSEDSDELGHLHNLISFHCVMC